MYLFWIKSYIKFNTFIRNVKDDLHLTTSLCINVKVQALKIGPYHNKIQLCETVIIRLTEDLNLK